MRNQPTSDRRSVDEDVLQRVVDAFKEGDRQAFRVLYDRFEHPIHRFCRHLVSDEALARDAFQETFIRMYEHRRDLRGENIQSWLFSIARRVCLNLLRSRRRTFEEFDEGQHELVEHVESDILLREHLDRALALLPVTLREALLLRDVEGHSYQEIAEIVGIDLSLAKVRVYRARLIMRKHLSPIVAERSK